MTQYVFDNAMVAHLWAQQSQSAARSHNGQFYFEGTTLFSYGRHFVVGRFVGTEAGETVVLLNSRSYSPTTGRHQSYAASALGRHAGSLQVFRVPDADPHHEDNLRHFEKVAADALQDAANPRRKRTERYNLEIAHKALEEAERYAAAFGVRWSFPGLDALRERAATAWAEGEVKRRADLAAKRAADAEAFGYWRAGVASYCPSSYHHDEAGSVYLRIRGDQLETSMGASVPLAHAVKVFRFVKACRERGEGWRANGRRIRVGHFTVDAITETGDMLAGCHQFSWARMCEAATAAGVADMAPSADAVEERASL